MCGVFETVSSTFKERARIRRKGGREGGRKACVISLVEVLILKTRNGRNKMRWNGIKWNEISTYKNR